MGTLSWWQAREREPITGVWRQRPWSRGQGQNPCSCKAFSFSTSNGSGRFASFSSLYAANSVCIRQCCCCYYTRSSWAGALSDAFVWRLSDVCLYIAYIGPKSRSERPMKTKIGPELAHVTRDTDTTFKVKRSTVKVTRPLFTAALNPSGSCTGQRGNILGVGNYCYVAMCSVAWGASALTEGGEERGVGISWRPPAYSLFRL